MTGSQQNALDFKMRSGTLFDKMMNAWCRHHGVDMSQAKFLLGDRELLPGDSPQSVGWTPADGCLTIQAMPRKPDVPEAEAPGQRPEAEERSPWEEPPGPAAEYLF